MTRKGKRIGYAGARLGPYGVQTIEETRQISAISALLVARNTMDAVTGRHYRSGRSIGHSPTLSCYPISPTPCACPVYYLCSRIRKSAYGHFGLKTGRSGGSKRPSFRRHKYANDNFRICPLIRIQFAILVAPVAKMLKFEFAGTSPMLCRACY